MTLSSHEKEHLCRAAATVAQKAYAPYSRFRVGAAVWGSQGMYLGTNVENASYGLALCAERSALARAIAEGEREIKAIAVACIDAPDPVDIQSLVPCGACRQWIAELAPNAELIICRTGQSFKISDLLPYAFRLGVSP